MPERQQSTSNDFSQLVQTAPPGKASSRVVNTTTTRTENYEGANAGGKVRERAEAKGDKEVQMFERAVQKLVRRMGVCPLGQPWYNMISGYLCAECIHFLYHKDIDMSFERPGWIPEVTYVNTFDDPSIAVSGTIHGKHPPPIDFHQPMHRTHQNKKHRKNKYKPKKNKYRAQRLPKKEVLRNENIYVPPKSPKPHHIGNQIEVHDPTVLPCKACGAVLCKDKSTCLEHKAPIVIAISSKGKSPAACGVFCNIDSSYNTTFMVHKDDLKFGEADLHAAIVALKKVYEFVTTVERRGRRGSPQSKRITQVVIKTGSSWLVRGFAVSTDHFRYNMLAFEFDKLVDMLGELNETPTVVKLWKAKTDTTAHQLAEATLKGWEEAKAQMKAEVQMNEQ